MHGEYFNIAHIEENSRIYGPGERFVIWLQGCTLACKGCWNQEMWSHKPHQLLHKEALLKQILSTPDITGITLLGGEPLQQWDNLNWLLEQLQDSELDTVLYTGYEMDELQDTFRANLQKLCDILICGRYQESQRNLYLRWRGSENQQILFMTDKYNSSCLAFVNEMEIHITQDGSMSLLGYPNSIFINDIRKEY